MGRKKINNEEKKQKLSITISLDNALNFYEHEIKNKSKLINWLLKEYFELNQDGSI